LAHGVSEEVWDADDECDYVDEDYCELGALEAAPLRAVAGELYENISETFAVCIKYHIQLSQTYYDRIPHANIESSPVSDT